MDGGQCGRRCQHWTLRSMTSITLGTIFFGGKGRSGMARGAAVISDQSANRKFDIVCCGTWPDTLKKINLA